jgi:hypothetical protein
MTRAAKTIMLLLALTLCARVIFAEVLQEITVKEGQTLWSVANYYLKDPQRWPEILKYNKMSSSDPNVILPGVKLVVPMLLIKETLRAAHLIYALNDVRYRRKSEAEWKAAAINMDLFNEDGLRTLQESRAKVKFPSGEVLQLDENSLIILRPEKTREEIDLLSGGVRASQTKVLTSDTVVDPKIVAHGERPDFRTKLKEDKTTLVEVYEGNVDVTAQGRTVTVNKGFGTEVRFRQPPSIARELPPELDMTDLSAPTGGEVRSTIGVTSVKSHYLELNVKEPATAGRGITPVEKQENRKSKSLGSKAGINRYHIQISSTSAFSAVLVDEINPIADKARIDTKKYNLGDGTYFYHLSYLDDMGFEGKFSIPVQFIIDNTPPEITIITPQDKDEVDSEFVHIEGTTRPGTTLTINNKPAIVDETGHFVSAIIPENGANEISFSAHNRAGITTQASITIYKVKTAAVKKHAGGAIETKLKGKGESFASTSLGILSIAVIIGVILLILL